MKEIYDVLSFKFFISPYALLFLYYLGAFVIPFGCWGLAKWLRYRYQVMAKAHDMWRFVMMNSTRKTDRIRLMTLFLLMFAFMELIWRMMFEFLIAYLQIRDALLGIAAS